MLKMIYTTRMLTRSYLHWENPIGSLWTLLHFQQREFGMITATTRGSQAHTRIWTCRQRHFSKDKSIAITASNHRLQDTPQQLQITQVPACPLSDPQQQPPRASQIAELAQRRATIASKKCTGQRVLTSRARRSRAPRSMGAATPVMKKARKLLILES